MANPIDKIPGTVIRFREAAVNGVHYVAIKAPDSIAANVTLTLPATDGASGEILRTDGNGALTWIPGADSLLGTANTWTLAQTFSSAFLSTALAPFGYGVGAGGTVTQLTSKSTGVTVDAPSGQITTHAENLNDATTVSFTVSNATVETTDVISICHDSGGTLSAYIVSANNIGTNTFNVSIRNLSGGPLAEALVLNYVVVRAAIA